MINELDLIETIIFLMYEYITIYSKEVSEPDFDEKLINYINEIIESQFENEDIEEELYEIIELSFELFYETIIPRRSLTDSIILTNEIDYNKISNQIKYLQLLPQPEQRTKEWYEFRNNLITASNAYKAFESQSYKNQLIYEKCKPIITREDDKFSMINIKSPFHWGQKYEPVSVMFYENRYKTKIGDFGCIQHPKYKFLGASPDGINIDITSKRYGRMLEIKNIVNREIDGIPKKEYWIQTQLQMEVCHLDECDFLETKFVEYENINNESPLTNFLMDGVFNYSNNDELKGVIMYFCKEDGTPHYEYMPFNIITFEQFEEWEQEKMQKNSKLSWINNIYWKLKEFSCVLIQRNKLWFENNISELKELWKIIENERKTGFEHRAPNKRIKNETNVVEKINGCFFNIDKELGKIICKNFQNENEAIEPNEKKIIQIRTKSFDESKNELITSIPFEN